MDIIDINEKNLEDYPAACFLNPQNEGYRVKAEWLKERFKEGFRIKQLYLDRGKKANGFIEYVAGKNAWRSVDAGGYLFIHCIWIFPNKNKEKGYGSMLVEEVVKEAEKEGRYGVAVVTSEGPFMAGKELFIKNGFYSVESAKPSYELMVKQIKEGPAPKFNDWEKQLKKYKGLNILYSKQCPWVARFIKEVKELPGTEELGLKITEIKDISQAQNAPSPYSVFNLIYDGRLLADHYISTRRFQNIINKL